jgi:alpha-1,3-glucan synthase
MVFPAFDYNNKLLYCTDGFCSIDNSFAAGADKWRYSFDYGGTWSEWALYTETFNTSPGKIHATWEGVHVMVQYWSALSQSAGPTVHADALYIGGERRNPTYLVRGKFNQWGLDAGMTMNLENNDNSDDGWTLAVSTLMPNVLTISSAHDTMASQYPAQRVWIRRLLLRRPKRR